MYCFLDVNKSRAIIFVDSNLLKLGKEELVMKKGFMHISKLIKNTRKAQGLTQNDLSQHLGYKNGQLISNIERGQASFPLKNIYALAEVLKVPIEDIKEAMVEDYKDFLNVQTIDKNQE